MTKRDSAEKSRPVRKNILFLLLDDAYVRNYIRTGVIRELSSHYNVVVGFGPEVTLRADLSRQDAEPLEIYIDPESARKHVLINQLCMWRFRKKSKTFLYRWMRMANWQLIEKEGPWWEKFFSWTRWIVGFLGNWPAIKVIVLGNKVVFPISFRYLTNSLSPNRELEAVLTEGAFDAVIFPSSAYEPAGMDAILACRNLGTKSLALIDNWDNLSSKTVFWARPDAIGVWGDQTVVQAETIHGFSGRDVYPIGTPRFQQYFDLRDSATVSPYNFPYLLFAGSAMAFDEIGILHQIEEALADLPRPFSSLKVVYRPHPWQQKRKTNARFELDDFSKTILDKQTAAYRYTFEQGVRIGSAFQPDLDYYPALLSNALAVVGPPTTMLLEAAICRSPVVCLSFSDGTHFSTSLRYFSHFDVLRDLPGFLFCENRDDIKPTLLEALSYKSDPTETIPAAIKNILNQEQGHGRYLNHLTSMVDEVCARD